MHAVFRCLSSHDNRLSDADDGFEEVELINRKKLKLDSVEESTNWAESRIVVRLKQK